jgi:hypothetical protein
MRIRCALAAALSACALGLVAVQAAAAPTYVKLIVPGVVGFGERVALSADGNTALISDFLGYGSDKLGAARVFTRSGSTWTQQGPRLTGGSEQVDEGFGTGLALSADGNTALVGALYDNERVGAAWVFTRSGSTWSQQGPKLTGAGEVGKGEFGEAVALSADGNTALIGGGGDNGSAGAVWVFTRSGSTWSQQGEKLTVGKGEGSYFGNSVSLTSDGNTALVAGGDASEAGPVSWVFTRSGTSWGERAKLAVEGHHHERALGHVALSGDGNTALMSSTWCQELLAFHEICFGEPYSVSRSGEAWNVPKELVLRKALPEDVAGSSMALSADGSVGLIGADGHEAPAPASRGRAWVIRRGKGGSWSRGERLRYQLPNFGNEFGRSVALSGDGSEALIGAPKQNYKHCYECGAAYVFSLG